MNGRNSMGFSGVISPLPTWSYGCLLLTCRGPPCTNASSWWAALTSPTFVGWNQLLFAPSEQLQQNLPYRHSISWLMTGSLSWLTEHHLVKKNNQPGSTDHRSSSFNRFKDSGYMGVLYIHSKDVTNISLSPMENEETHLPKLRSNLGHLCFVGRVPNSIRKKKQAGRLSVKS